MPNATRCTILLTWLPEAGELRVHLESWQNDGERWHLSKTRHEGVDQADELLRELRYLLLEVHTSYE